MSIYRAPPLPPTLPRAIVRRPEAAGPIRWLVRLLIVPHTLAGVGLLIALLLSLASATLGSEDVGHVVSSKVTSHRNKNGVYYQREVTFTYQSGGGERVSSGTVDLGRTPPPDADLGLPPGSTVRIWRRGPVDALGVSVLGPRESPWDQVGVMGFGATFWCGIMSFAIYLLWVKPLMYWRAFRWGRVLPGSIIHKRIRQGKSVQYLVDFEVYDGDLAPSRRTVLVSSKALFDRVTEGQEVTVLSHPRWPFFSVVYECGDYDWAEGTPAPR